MLDHATENVYVFVIWNNIIDWITQKETVPWPCNMLIQWVMLEQNSFGFRFFFSYVILRAPQISEFTLVGSVQGIIQIFFFYRLNVKKEKRYVLR